MEDAVIPLFALGAIIVAVYIIGWIFGWIWYGLYIAALSIVSFIDSYRIFFYGASTVLMVFACVWLIQGGIQAAEIDKRNKRQKKERDSENKRLQDITISFNKYLISLKSKVNNIEWKK